MKNPYAGHSYQYGIVYKIGHCLQGLISTHAAYIYVLFEVQLLFVHAVLGLRTDVSTFGRNIRLLGLRVCPFQSVQLDGGFDAAECNDGVLAVYLQHFAYRSLPFYLDIASGYDCCEAFGLFPRLLFCQCLCGQCVFLTSIGFLLFLPVLFFFQFFYFTGNLFFLFFGGKSFHRFAEVT